MTIIMARSIIEKAEDGFYNTTAFFNSKGEIIAK